MFAAAAIDLAGDNTAAGAEYLKRGLIGHHPQLQARFPPGKGEGKPGLHLLPAVGGHDAASVNADRAAVIRNAAGALAGGKEFEPGLGRFGGCGEINYRVQYMTIHWQTGLTASRQAAGHSRATQAVQLPRRGLMRCV